MIILALVLMILLAPFLIIVVTGAPYVPTHQKEIEALFDQLKLKQGSLVVDLGSGDGRFLLTAAKRGYAAIGYEINPYLAVISIWRLRKFPAAKVKIGSMWKADLSQADAVFTFQSSQHLEKLRTQILPKLKRGAYFVSFAFALPNTEITLKHGSMHIYKT